MPKQIKVDNREVMEAIMHLFWVKGYMATTIDDLVEKTGFSKSFIYTNYGKKGLFEAAFDFYIENYTDPFLQALTDDSRGIEAFRDKLGLLADSLLYNTMPKACLFVNTVVEMGAKDKDIVFLNEKYIEHVYEIYSDKLNYCYKLGEIKDPSLIPLYTEMLINLLFSLAVLYKTHSKEELEAFIDSQLALIQ